MRQLARDSRSEDQQIVLGLLESVERGGTQSQRELASGLGIALGLVNAYLKRCVKKGLVKVREAPARRYAYYLTPKGFSEKSRLTVEYLSSSFSFFRQARTDCSRLIQEAKANGVRKMLLAGQSDLAEIAALCAMEHGIEIVGVVQADAGGDSFIGLPVYTSFAAVPAAPDAVLITDLRNGQASFEAAEAQFGTNRVFVPELLRTRFSRTASNGGGRR